MRASVSRSRILRVNWRPEMKPLCRSQACFVKTPLTDEFKVEAMILLSEFFLESGRRSCGERTRRISSFSSVPLGGKTMTESLKSIGRGRPRLLQRHTSQRVLAPAWPVAAQAAYGRPSGPGEESLAHRADLSKSSTPGGADSGKGKRHCKLCQELFGLRAVKVFRAEDIFPMSGDSL